MKLKSLETVQRSRGTHIAISSEIDAVIHGQLPIGSKTNPAEGLQDDNDGDEEVGK